MVLGMSRGVAGFENVAHALRIRNYRIYTIGNLISLSGTWVQRVAVGWHRRQRRPERRVNRRRC